MKFGYRNIMESVISIYILEENSISSKTFVYDKG